MMARGDRSRPPNTCVYCGISSWRLDPDGEDLWACRCVSACEARILKAASKVSASICDTCGGYASNPATHVCAPAPTLPPHERKPKTRPSTGDLPARQRQIFDFIKSYTERRHIAPTVREIGRNVGLTSSSTIHAHLAALQRRGLIRREPYSPRAIEVVGEVA
jgi:hypothetical protein